MNTLTRRDALLNNEYKETIILLEDLEFGMTREQLTNITNLHNDGIDFQEISKKIKRHPFEVLIALLHQAKTNNVRLRPFAYKVNKPLNEYKKDKSFTSVVDVKKVKKGTPSVIEISGRRYVYEPETKRK